MKITTTRFAEIDVAEENIITFNQGLLGFDDARQFVILPNPGGGPLEWLQSLEHSDLAFVLCDPQMVVTEYQLNVQLPELAAIEVDDLATAMVKVIVRVPPVPDKPTANLMGPLFFNTVKKLGMQYVVNNSKWSCRHEIGAS
jgi:flagellar assembly factor FliW